MSTSYAANYIAALEDSTRERLDQAARPMLDAKARAQQLYHALMVAKAAGFTLKARDLAQELRPLLSYLD